MYKKIFILLGVSMVVTVLWFSGLEKLYADLLTFSTNTVLSAVSDHTHIKLEKQETDLIFRVHTLIDGRKGSYPQAAQSLLLPAVIVISWLVIMFYSLPRKTAIKQALTDIGIFLIFQIIFLILLTSYYNSNFAKYFFHVMLESFYVLAIIIIIKDSLKYPEIWGRRTDADSVTAGT